MKLWIGEIDQQRCLFGEEKASRPAQLFSFETKNDSGIVDFFLVERTKKRSLIENLLESSEKRAENAVEGVAVDEFIGFDESFQTIFIDKFQPKENLRGVRMQIERLKKLCKLFSPLFNISTRFTVNRQRSKMLSFVEEFLTTFVGENRFDVEFSHRFGTSVEQSEKLVLADNRR